VKKIIPYNLFEGMTIKTSTSNVNEKEVESIVTDICADFMDDYDVEIDFNWGSAVSVRSKRGEDIYDLRSDSQIRMFRKQNITSQIGLIKKYLDEVDSSNNRFVTVEFRRPKDYSTLNIWKDGIEDDYKKIMNFVKDYFPNVQVVDNSPVITAAIWAINFSIIFK
jgi:hypothetical protein